MSKYYPLLIVFLTKNDQHGKYLGFKTPFRGFQTPPKGAHYRFWKRCCDIEVPNDLLGTNYSICRRFYLKIRGPLNLKYRFWKKSSYFGVPNDMMDASSIK